MLILSAHEFIHMCVFIEHLLCVMHCAGDTVTNKKVREPTLLEPVGKADTEQMCQRHLWHAGLMGHVDTHLLT